MDGQSPTSRGRLGALLRELSPYRPRIAVGLFLSVLSVLLGLVQPLLMKAIVDEAIPGRRVGLLMLLLLGLVALPVAITLLGACQAYFLNSIGQRVARNLRVRLYAAMLRLPMPVVADTKPGDMVHAVANDCGEIEAYLSQDLLPSVATAVQLVGLVTVMLYLDWRLALVGLVAFPLALGVVRLLGGRAADVSRLRSQHRAAGASLLHETLGNVRAIKLFGAEGYEVRRFEDWNRRDLALWLRHEVLERFVEQVSYRSLNSLGVGLVFALGALRVMRGEVSLGSLVAFVAYLPQTYQALNTLLSTHVVTSRIDAPLQRVYGYMHGTALEPEPSLDMDFWAQQPEPGAIQGELRFERVSFAYKDGRGRLDEVTFEVNPGETVAIVGYSGGGKSTIFDLITRIYEPQAGGILLDGQDLRDFPLEEVRRHVGLVSQDVTIWNTSVFENIRYGMWRASREDVEQVARLAQIHDLVEALPEGYDTLVGDRGVRLSGGERQRIAIARVLLREPRVLLLDEVTSALDSVVEEKLMAALRPLFADRTVLIIAHRLATVLSADRILVLDGGRIVEEGSHGELIGRGGLYRRLYETQFAGAVR